MRQISNAIGFQMGWWICIASVSRGLEIHALIFCTGLALAHLYFSKFRISDVKLACVALFIGVITDSLLQYFSVIHFFGWSLGWLSPFWLWMLWILFAMTLNASLSFLQRQHLLISALLGFIFGPLTYYAGSKFGAASLEISFAHISLLTLTWMFTLPMMVFMAKKYTQPQGFQ